MPGNTAEDESQIMSPEEEKHYQQRAIEQLVDNSNEFVMNSLLG